MVPRRIPLFDSGTPLRSVCPYCGTGCGILAEARDGVVSKVTGDPEHPVNRGQLCAKGALIAEAVTADTRLLHPLVRSRRLGPLERVGWDEAVEAAASAIQRAVEQDGPDSVMFYGSGQLLTEDYYLLGKLAKGFIGTNNQDTNSRLCMSSAVVAYQRALGSDAPPCSYEDIDQAGTFLIVGANVEACHPILFNRIRARKRAGEDVRVIVIDPRRTRTAEIADLHLAVRPGGDVPLLNALLYAVDRLGAVDEAFVRDHTSGWVALRASLPEFAPDLVEDASGVAASDIIEAARLIARDVPLLTLWTMGVNQSSSGVEKNHALINLSLATGNIGKPGAGPFSLTGQPNAMGGREAGGLAGSLPGHRSVADACHRAEVERAWGLAPGAISPRPGLTAMEMIEALESGRISVVWVAASNPLASLPNSRRVQRAFARAKTVIVQDAYHPTETTRDATIVLPAAQWSERAGTMTNSERRICFLEQIGTPPGEALPDWEIFARVARALGFGEAFAYRDPEEIFDEYRELTRGRDLDITGVTYAALRGSPEGIQWPFPEGSTGSGTTRLFEDGQFSTPDRRARFVVAEYRLPGDELDPDFPIALVTGRVKDQWHTMTRTARVPRLLKNEARPFLEVHPEDASRSAVRDGDTVRVTSRRGSTELPARVTDRVRPGTVFAPFHWGPLNGLRTSPNRSAGEAVDPLSLQPELKFAAVRLERVSRPAARAGSAPS